MEKLYVLKKLFIVMFFKGDKKNKVSRNQKHHEKRLKKTLDVMFSDFLLLIISKPPLKNITNNFFFCAQNIEYTIDFTLF